MFKCVYIWLLVAVVSFDIDMGQLEISQGSLAQNLEAIDVTYHTEMVPDEFIVKFRHFYWKNTRAEYLQRALFRVNISKFEVLPRANIADEYPSDFDVIRISSATHANLEAFGAFVSHPAIKLITPQRCVRRVLHYSSQNGTAYTQSDYGQSASWASRRLLRVLPLQITSKLEADALWKLGITGKGVKIAVFDTGLARNHPHFRCVKERTNWTNEKSLDDGVSHGTFVAGIIASAKQCLGFAPDAELHIYKVFTNTQISYTSWFLDAFNFVIFRKINVLNLSIGGPDFLDHPFVEKVLELSANKVIMVTAIGNDGPLYGTLNNPGDQSDVIGVGGINFDEKVSKFSSRGMTTWELPIGYGRLKPDIVTFGSQVTGSNVFDGCRSLSGTSVASPVVAGAISLIMSGALHKSHFFNPSSVKQVLIEGASRLLYNNMFEQGHGKLNILKSMQLLSTYVPKVTLSPSYLDFTESYMWPYSSQPLFCGSMPVIINVTILNGVAVTGKIVELPKWHSYVDKNGNLLDISLTFSPTLWPWSGWMAAHITVNENGCNFEGVSRGHISLIVQNPSQHNQNTITNSTVYFPVTVKIIPRPPRHKRILWDQYHNLRYPPGYIPRDNLKMKSDPLDWRADHIHTNFRDMYSHLRGAGYYIDVLGMPYTCFNASSYGTLLIVDPEEEFFEEEILKIQSDVYDSKLSVIVFADWYNASVITKIKFFDENTRQWWIPDTGGANVPALNDLLRPFGIAFDDFVAEGYFNVGDHSMHIASGAILAKFPSNREDIIIGAELSDQGSEILENSSSTNKHMVPILGLFQPNKRARARYLESSPKKAFSSYTESFDGNPNVKNNHINELNPIINKRILLKSNVDQKYNIIKEEKIVKLNRVNAIEKSEGRIAVFGDSNCLDSTYLEKPCFWLLDNLLEFTMNSHKSSLLRNLNRSSEFKKATTEDKAPPLRLSSSYLYHYSKVTDPHNKLQKRPVEKCQELIWADPHYVNYSDAMLLINRAENGPSN